MPSAALLALGSVLVGAAGSALGGVCLDQQHLATDCARQVYNESKVPDSGRCCELCASEEGCAQWTYHSWTHACSRTKASESFKKGPTTLFSTCGVRAPSPPPSPGTGSTWAVIAAGSSGFSNYRHQADACHAYQLLKKSGIPEDHIILMMQDDVADSFSNPFKGQLYNKPGDNSPDVYAGCKVDYRGSQVTAKLFLAVITGEASAVPAGGKVLKSGKTDRVFLNFVDHGGTGIVAFPNGPVLTRSELSTALQTMQQRQMFSELVFYMEACESGSMFPDLPADGKIFAVTASNARESSWGYYCSPSNDTVKGKHLNTCLGDLFSIAWMEDSDLGQLSSESLKEQVRRVTARTTKSHVTTFGDRSFEDESIGKFELAPAGAQREAMAAAAGAAAEGAIDVRDIPLRMAYYAWERSASGRERALAWDQLQRVVAARKADEALFASIAGRACEGAGYGCAHGVMHGRHELRDAACHMALAHAVHEACPARAEHNPGGWNAFNMQFSQALVNMCEAKEALKKDTGALLAIVRDECMAASAAAGARELVV